MKKFILIIIGPFSFIWRKIPLQVTKKIFLLFFILESRNKDARKGLIRLFSIEDSLALVINERALALGKGEHPKHQLIGYHNFFIENLKDCNQILDIGCGYGAVARSIAHSYPKARVTAIDNDRSRYEQAISNNNPSNLTFHLVDLIDFEVNQKFDAVVLSNVLEHLTDRVAMLELIQTRTRASKYLIRVPSFERHWTIPLRKELGLSYFQDEDHKIEHTLEDFYEEVSSAGLSVTSIRIKYGEIWSICEK